MTWWHWEGHWNVTGFNVKVTETAEARPIHGWLLSVVRYELAKFPCNLTVWLTREYHVLSAVCFRLRCLCGVSRITLLLANLDYCCHVAIHDVMLCLISGAGVSQSGADTTGEGVATTGNQEGRSTARIIRRSSGFYVDLLNYTVTAAPQVNSGKHCRKFHLTFDQITQLFSVAARVCFKLKDSTLIRGLNFMDSKIFRVFLNMFFRELAKTQLLFPVWNMMSFIRLGDHVGQDRSECVLRGSRCLLMTHLQN